MDTNNSYLENIGLITVQNLSDFLRNARWVSVKCILLNQVDMDKLAMEVRETYRDYFFEPYSIHGVRIREDYERSTPVGRIRVVRRG